MSDICFSCSAPQERGEGRVEVLATIPENSPFFSGHFPGQPIVPGIAMLAMVEAAVMSLDHGLSPGRVVAGFKRVKFRRPVQPGGQFLVSLVPHAQRPETELAFEICWEGEQVCDGRVVAEIRQLDPAQAGGP